MFMCLKTFFAMYLCLRRRKTRKRHLGLKIQYPFCLDGRDPTLFYKDSVLPKVRYDLLLYT